MKLKLFLVVLMLHIAIMANSQCNCGSSVSFTTYAESGGSKVNLNKKQLLAEFYGDYRSFSHHNHLEENHTHSHGNSLSNHEEELLNSAIGSVGLRFGLNEKITFIYQQTYLSHHTSVSYISGIGDMMLGSIIKLHEINNFSISALAGLRIPTGRKVDLSNTENIFIGTGSTDPLLGIIAIKTFHKSFVRANANYRHGTKGFESRNFGNFFNHSLLFGYSFIGETSICNKSIKENKNRFATLGIINITGEMIGRQTLNNELVSNTGGYLLFAEPGLQFGYGRFFMPISFSVPLYQNYFGEQNNTNFRIRAGLLFTI